MKQGIKAASLLWVLTLLVAVALAGTGRRRATKEHEEERACSS